MGREGERLEQPDSVGFVLTRLLEEPNSGKKGPAMFDPRQILVGGIWAAIVVAWSFVKKHGVI